MISRLNLLLEVFFSGLGLLGLDVFGNKSNVEELNSSFQDPLCGIGNS